MEKAQANLGIEQLRAAEEWDIRVQRIEATSHVMSIQGLRQPLEIIYIQFCLAKVKDSKKVRYYLYGSEGNKDRDTEKTNKNLEVQNFIENNLQKV